MSIPTFTKILYATDMGQNMQPVFRHAISLAQQYQANIIMMHVAEPLGSSVMSMLELYMPGKMASFGEDEMKKILTEMKKRLEEFHLDELGDDSNLVSDIVVVSGHPAEEITKYAARKDVDLIVVGTHTGDEGGAALLGSTARKLVYISDRPVLVIPVKK